MAVLNQRRARLWAAIRTQGGTWTTGRASAVLRELGAPKRTTAASDLRFFAEHGLLTEHGPINNRHYSPTGGTR